MNINSFMPVKVISDADCVINNSKILSRMKNVCLIQAPILHHHSPSFAQGLDSDTKAVSHIVANSCSLASRFISSI